MSENTLPTRSQLIRALRMSLVSESTIDDIEHLYGATMVTYRGTSWMLEQLAHHESTHPGWVVNEVLLAGGQRPGGCLFKAAYALRERFVAGYPSFQHALQLAFNGILRGHGWGPIPHNDNYDPSDWLLTNRGHGAYNEVLKRAITASGADDAVYHYIRQMDIAVSHYTHEQVRLWMVGSPIDSHPMPLRLSRIKHHFNLVTPFPWDGR